MKLHVLVQLLLVAVVAAVIGGSISVLVNTGFKSEDVFALAGAFAGAAGTVAGAAWLSDRAANAAKRREQALLIEECEALLTPIRAAIALVPDGAWPMEYRQSLHAVEETAREVPALLREAIAHAVTLNFRQRVKVVKAEAAILSFLRFYNDAFGENELEPFDERDFPSELNYTRECLEQLVAELRKD